MEREPERQTTAVSSHDHGRNVLRQLSFPVHPDHDRLLAFVRRELGAQEAVVADDDGDEPRREESTELRCALGESRVLVVRFDAPVDDREAKLRRLEMLVHTFSSALEESSPGVHPSRPPAAAALQDELQALRTRAAALNVVVIDANSPVIWGAAEPGGLATDWSAGAGPERPRVAEPGNETGVLALSLAAIDRLRGDRDVAARRKGKHVRHIERGGDVPFLAHSFAGIYWLLLMYEAPFDELRAERAMLESLPRVERLVMALPPMDPSPQAGARAMARPRRR